MAGVTLGSVTSYISAIVGAEQRFRPHQHIGGSVGGDAIPEQAKRPKGRAPEQARLPAPFPAS